MAAPFMLGPVELFVVEFTGTEADPRVIDALGALDGGGQVRLVDLVIVARLADGEVRVTERSELVSDGVSTSQSAELLAEGLIGEEDIEDAAQGLVPGTGAALAVLEMRWATVLSSALADAGGRVAHVALIPAPAINEFVAQAGTDTPRASCVAQKLKERV